MRAFVVAVPILPGKEEQWRRFAQELLGSRLLEYEAFRQRMGLDKESVWLAYSRRQELAVAYLEIEEPEQVLRLLTTSEEPFDVWFKHKLMEFHGCDLTQPRPRCAPEPIFAYPGLPEAEPPRTGDGIEWTAVPAREGEG